MNWRTSVILCLLALGVSWPVWTQVQTPPQKTGTPIETQTDLIQTSSQTIKPPASAIQTSSQKIEPPSEMIQTPSAKITPPNPFSLNVNGTLSWVLKYGLGDSRGLSKKGFANVLLIEQHIAVDVDGSVKITTPISGTLTISAQLDNQKSDNLQDLQMSFGNETMLLAFGDFAMGRAGSEFVASGHTLKGLEFTYTPSDAFKMIAQAARVEGESQKRCFRGNTSEGQTLFALHQPDKPWLDQPYESSIRGLEYYLLTSIVVEGFTKVKLAFPATNELKQLLKDYGLDFIYDQIVEEPATELERFNYEIISEENKYYLALKREALDLLRTQIRNYIDTYNEDNDLSGDQVKSYPLNEGKEYELGFLNKLAKRITLNVQDEPIDYLSYTRGRFFYVGYSQITEETVKIEIKLNGQFVDITDPSLSEIYKAKTFADIGILDLQFPESFFSNLNSEIKVKFDYAVSGQVYFLGLSVLKDSERVLLNGKALKRDDDYVIDYEVGALTLLQELGEEDKLCIDFELLRGGLGSAVDFQRTFIGSTMGWHPLPGFSLDFDVYRASDNQPRPEGKDRRNIMPNEHTALGVSGQFDFDSFQSHFNIGFAQNLFPSGDPRDNPGQHTNQKINLPNQINIIAPFEHEGQQLIIFGHQNGLTVYDGRRWEDFGPVEGLSGSTVHSIAASPNLLLIGTEFGLTRVHLDQGMLAFENLSKQINWKRFRESEREGNLPDNTVHAIFIDEAQIVWIGTEKGLARVPLNELNTKSAWKLYNFKQTPTMLSNKILSLNGQGPYVYLGTDKGLVILDTRADTFQPVEETRNQPITQLVRSEDSLYGASSKGLFLLTPVHLLSWVLENKKIQSMTVHEGKLFYGTSGGLFEFPQDSALIAGRSVTALGSSPTGLWAGPSASAIYELPVWRVVGDDVAAYSQSETKINGRDERRFADIDAAKNADYGWAGDVSTQFNLGGLQVSARLEAITPEFLGIGQEDRRDVQQIVLGASYPFTLPLLGQMSLSGQHSMGMINLSPTRPLIPSGTMRDVFDLDWTITPIGLKLGFDFGLDQTENDIKNAGYDIQRYHYGISASQNFNLKKLLPLSESLSMSASYSIFDNQVHTKKDSNFKDEKISASSALRLAGGLGFSGSYSRTSKTRFVGTSTKIEGDQAYNWRSDWNGKFDILSIASSYAQAYRMKLSDGKGSRDDNATLDLRLKPLDIEDLSLTPSGSGSFRMNFPFPTPEAGTPNSLAWQGEGRLRGEWLEFSGQTSYRQNFSHDKNKKVNQSKGEFSASLEWEGIAELQPGFDFSMSTETLSRLDKKEAKINNRQSASAHVDWEISTDMSNSASLSWQAVQTDRENTNNFTLSDKLNWAVSDKLSARLESAASYVLGKRDPKDKGTNKFEIESIAYADYQVGTDLTASFTMGALGGLDLITARNSYLSFVISVQGTLLFGAGERR